MRLNCSEWWDATKVLGTDGLDRPERSDAKELLGTDAKGQSARAELYGQ